MESTFSVWERNS